MQSNGSARAVAIAVAISVVFSVIAAMGADDSPVTTFLVTLPVCLVFSVGTVLLITRRRNRPKV